MSMRGNIMELRTSPHLHGQKTVESIMRNVVWALLPVCAYSVYAFGLSALALIVTCTLVCLLTEHLACRWSGKDTSINDYSAIITGILLALTLPPAFPLWMGAVGAFLSITLGKLLFGGIGFNVFNPALVARAFLQAAFPVAITTWTPACYVGRFSGFAPSTLTFPFTTPRPVTDWVVGLGVDGFSGATPLSLFKFGETPVVTDTLALITGNVAGSAGETSAILILLCGLYLIARKMMEWRIPVAMLGMAVLTSGVFYLYDNASYPSPIFVLFSGGLMLGAMFMATDMVSSPVAPLGIWIYGALIGFITVIIRLLGGLPEGVMYAILLGNALSPLIDTFTQPRIYGARKKAKAEG